MILDTLSPSEIDEIYSSGAPELQRLLHRATTQQYYSFQPRPDSTADFDEQTAFIESDAPFSICLGGTGSGKTIAAAHKTARYVLETKPPRIRCPFWIIGHTFDQVCEVCWNQKLSQIIPPECIYGIDWYRSKRNWPTAVFLRHPDDPSEIGWVLDFKSYEQGLAGMKGSSIGGYWFNEEVPLPIVEEVQGRCRDYNSPGWADFTPLEVVSPEWPEVYDRPRDGWKFFHLNTERNFHLAPGWAKWFLSQIPIDLRDTRRIGTFSTFVGQVFKEWKKAIHVCEPFKIPADWHKVRGIDFGFNNPFACVWCARSPDGIWYVYREHYAAGRLNDHHAAQIGEEPWDDSNPHFGPTYSDHDAQQRAEMSSYGINCTPANKSNLIAGITHLRSLMMVRENNKPRFYVFDTCQNAIDEITNYRFPSGTATRNPNDAPIDKDNHAIDAIRYAIYSDDLGELRSGIPQFQQRQALGGRHGIMADLRQRERDRRDGGGSGDRDDSGENRPRPKVRRYFGM